MTHPASIQSPGTQTRAVYALLSGRKRGMTALRIADGLKVMGFQSLAVHTLLSHVREQLPPGETLEAKYKKLPGMPRALLHYRIVRKEAV